MRLFGHVSDSRLVGDQILLDIGAVEQDVAGGRRHQPREHLDCRGLPGSIGAQVAEHFSRLHGKADVADRRQGAVAFGDVADFEHEPLDTGNRREAVR